MNPARRLAALLTSWTVPDGQSPLQVRTAGASAWSNTNYAVDLARQVERALDGLDLSGTNTQRYRKHLETWYAAVYSQGREWTTSVNGHGAMNLLPEAALDVLELLADLLDRIALEQEVPQSDRDVLVELFDEALGIINDTVEIPENERVALLGLVQACRVTLGRLDIAGTTTLRQQVAELSMSLVTASLRLPDPEKQMRFRELALKMWGRAGAVASTAAITEGVNEALKAITGAF